MICNWKKKSMQENKLSSAESVYVSHILVGIFWFLFFKTIECDIFLDTYQEIFIISLLQQIKFFLDKIQLPFPS